MDKKTWQLIQLRKAQARQMQAAAQQRARLAGSIGGYPIPYGGLATAVLQRQAVVRRQVAALQRTDPARFAAIQKHVASARMQAALQQRARLAGSIVGYPIPYGALGIAALQRQAVVKMQVAALQRSDPARFAAVQRHVAAARMRAAALQAQLDITIYPFPSGDLSTGEIQRQARAKMQAAVQMRAAALQAQLGIRAYPIPYGGLSGAVLQRQATARAQAGQSRRAAEIKKRLLQLQQAKAQKAKKRR